MLNNFQASAEAELSKYLAPATAKQAASDVAAAIAGDLRAALFPDAAVKAVKAVPAKAVKAAKATNGNGHTNGNGNGHAAVAKKGPTKKVAAPAALAPKKEAKKGTSSVSGPAKEVMRLKKRLYWAEQRLASGNPETDDAELIARKAEINALSTADFISRNLTADNFLKKASKKPSKKAAPALSSDLPV